MEGWGKEVPGASESSRLASPSVKYDDHDDHYIINKSGERAPQGKKVFNLLLPGLQKNWFFFFVIKFKF